MARNNDLHCFRTHCDGDLPWGKHLPIKCHRLNGIGFQSHGACSPVLKRFDNAACGSGVALRHRQHIRQINPPHHNTRASRASEAHASSLTQVDQLDISHEADLVSRVREMPSIRQDRVAEIRAQIASGAYETDDKLNGALERLLDEIG